MSYLKDLLQTRAGDHPDIFENAIIEKSPKFQKETIEPDWTYAVMHLACQSMIKNIAEQNSSRLKLLDVGSHFSFISFASSFFDVVMLEPRVKDADLSIKGICNLYRVTGEAQNLPFQDGVFNLVTSLHAVEHFGLGRYGDTLDYFGDQRGIKEFIRVLSPGGILIIAVPAAKKSEIEFNGQRKYNPADFEKIVTRLGVRKLQSFISYVHGSRQDGINIGSESSIEDYSESFTPPVLISVYQKEME